MKALIKLVLTATVLFNGVVFAHSEGHGRVDVNQVIQAAQTAAKTLTFRDKGMSVGKLDSSWNKVAKDAFRIVEESDNTLLIKATNEHTNQTVFFVVSKGGKVLDVKAADSFKQDHGHSH